MKITLATVVAICLAGPAVSAEVYERPIITNVPTVEQRKAVRPEALTRQKTYGAASFSCTMAVTGTLTDCALLNETPQNIGLEEAARKLLPQMRGTTARLDGTPRADKMLAVVVLYAPMSSPGEIKTPSRAEISAAAPPDAMTRGMEANVSVSCILDASGAMTSCHAVTNLGIDPSVAQAALGLAAKIKAKPREVAGKPVATIATIYIDWVGYDEPAKWVTRPDARAFQLAYPTSGVVAKKGGQGVLKCRITQQGQLAGCVIQSETPVGSGFGAAALSLSTTFGFKPAVREGQPVETSIVIPVNFPPPGDTARTTSVRFNLEPVWKTAPTAAQVSAAFPARARSRSQAGQVTLQCHVDAEGVLSGCSTIAEAPTGQGYAQSARSLVPAFSMKMGPGGGEPGMLNLRFNLMDPAGPAWSARQLTKPRWKMMPDTTRAHSVFPDAAADQGLTRGTARVVCAVAEGGQLTSCKSVGETPAGLGFGAAGEKIAGAFVVNPWSDEGLPVDGVSLTLPIAIVRNPDATEPSRAPNPG